MLVVARMTAARKRFFKKRMCVAVKRVSGDINPLLLNVIKITIDKQ